VIVREVTVIADDLTGAADCGITFAAAGLPTFVAFGVAPAPAWARIVAEDTDSRQAPPAVAAARTREASARAYGDRSRAIYKKIDSTLRGHAGVEIAAAHAAATDVAGGASPLVVAAPAFPATGRTVRDGRVRVDGVPLPSTEIWRKSGMSGPPDLPDMLREAGLVAATIGGDVVRLGAERLAAEVARLAQAGVQAVVCDAEVEDDLERIAGAGARLRMPIVWAGSAGLARHLPAALGLAPPGPRAAPDLPHAAGPILFAVGSRSSVAREQARLVADERGVETVTVGAEALLSGSTADAEASVRAALAAGRDVVLLIGLEQVVELSRGAELAAALGRIVAATSEGLGGLVATGGDVARGALAALGAGGLRLIGEVEPGVPVGEADARRRLPVVTKAGAFGDPDTLRRCRAALRTSSSLRRH
jgi:4-hydroxythreonine-4-phosphate dehydrogenase